jgi:hypothetical protein
LRKISRNCRSERIYCRAILAGGKFVVCWLSLLTASTVPAANAQATEIELPPAPKSAPPPTIPKEKDPIEVRKQERERKRQDANREIEAERARAADKDSMEKSQREAQKPRGLFGFTELSLNVTKAMVSSGRSNYAVDPTVHVNTYVRTLWNSDPDVLQPWIGLRIAPFTGYGTQGKLTGRFAHTWIGPSFGLGKISKADDITADYPVRHAILVSGGIAAVARLGAKEESSPPLPRDFKPTPWAQDAPGVWTELRFMTVTRGALGWGGMLGVQTGSGKVFVYAGVIGSGFY